MKRNSELRNTLPTECRCVPANPFYVRWLNRFGGFDYWLFAARQQYIIKQESQELFNPYIQDPIKASGSDYVINKNISSKIVVGAESLTLNEWEELSLICISPQVAFFQNGTWFDCVVDKSDNDFFTDNELHAIELTLKLPRLQLQI